jgi:hypothetical protein
VSAPPRDVVDVAIRSALRWRGRALELEQLLARVALDRHHALHGHSKMKDCADDDCRRAASLLNMQGNT